MSQIAAGRPAVRSAVTPTQVPGSAFYGLVAGLWGAFIALLAASPATLEDAYDWLTGLPIVWEVLMWILTLPWAIAYLVYDSSWAHWLRVLLLVLIVVFHLSICAPRARR